jgi:signal peptidase
MSNLIDDEPATRDPNAWREDWPPSWGFRRLLPGAAAALLAVLVLAAAIVPAVIGAEPMTVLTKSMEPVLSPGDVVVMEPPDPDGLNVGDIVSYMPDPSLDFGYRGVTTTHRIISLVRQDGRVTKIGIKGDANPLPDPFMASPDQIRGRLLYTVPYVGIPALAAHNAGFNLWMLVVTGIGGYALLAWVSKQLRSRPTACARR